MSPGLARAAAAIAFAACGACTARDTVATSEEVDDLEGFCTSNGQAVLADGACTGDLAADFFRHAVCACNSLAFNDVLETDGFDSRMGSYVPGDVGGNVGSNIGIDANLAMTIVGDLTVGSDGVEAGPTLDVKGQLSSAGPLGRSGSNISVTGSAYVAGDVTVMSLAVDGTLITRTGGLVQGTITGRHVEIAEVVVPEPCRCDDIDVPSLVALHRVHNHNTQRGIPWDVLHDVQGDALLELECGRYYLDDISGSSNGTVLIRASGRTALFVEGNVTLQQGLTIELGDGAELDIFVGGFVQVSGAISVGDPDRPAALRIYVGSNGSINLSAGSTLAANLHAAHSDLNLSAAADVYGSLVVNRINSSASLKVHRDRAVETPVDCKPNTAARPLP